MRGNQKFSQGVNRDEAKGRQGAFLLHQVQKSMNIVHLNKKKRVERRGSSMSKKIVASIHLNSQKNEALPSIRKALPLTMSS